MMIDSRDQLLCQKFPQVKNDAQMDFALAFKSFDLS
jgi:hypothetical protein